MAVGAGRLDVFLGLDAAEFTKGLSKAELDAAKFQKNLVRLGTQVGAAVGAGLVAAAAGVGYLTKSALDANDKLAKLAQSANISVESLGGIGYAASLAGSDLEGVAQSFGRLNIKIAEAARGEKEASEAFNALGISVKNAAGQTRNADEVFKDIAAAFASYADGPEKAALGNALFGKSYQALLPLLAGGADGLQENIDYYNRFGKVSTETAKASEYFNDTLSKIEFVSGQLSRKLAEELLPGLQAVADEFLRVAEESNAFENLAKVARTAFEAIAIAAANVVFVFQGVGREIAAIAAQMTALATLDIDAFNAISKAVKEDGEIARRELDALERRILGIAAGPSLASRIGMQNPDRLLERMNRGQPSAPRLPGAGSTTKAAKENKEAIDENTQAYARYVEQLDQAVRREENLTKVQEVNRAINEGRFGELIPQQKEVLLFLAQAADAQDEYNRKIAHNAELEREIAAAMTERKQRLDDLTGRSIAERDLKDLRLLDEALRDNIISLEEFIAATDKIAGFDKDLENVNDAAEELGLTFSSALEDAIVDFNSLRDVLKGLEDDLVRIGTRKLVTEPLANWFSGLFSGMGGGGGSFLSSLFGGGQSMVGVFASGSDFVPRDGMAYVHRGERIVPASENAGIAGGAINVTNNFNFADQPTRQTITQIRDEVGRGIEFARRRNG